MDLALSRRMRCSAAVDYVYGEIPLAIPVDVTHQRMRPALDTCYSSAGRERTEKIMHTRCSPYYRMPGGLRYEFFEHPLPVPTVA